MTLETIDSIIKMKDSIDTKRVTMESIVITLETSTELMFNEFPDDYPDAESWEADAQWIDMYRIYVNPATVGFNVEVYPWSWSQSTILSEEPLMFKVNSEELLRILDPEQIQDILLKSYPRLFKREED